MRRVGRALLVVALAGALSSCAVSPAERQAIDATWAQRDAERAAECRRNGAEFAAGGCVFRGP
jgi:hypothetical protein